MRAKARLLTATFAAIGLAVMLSGCGGKSGGGGHNDGGLPGDAGCQPWRLVAISPLQMLLAPGGSIDLQVRYESCDAQPLEGGMVTFELQGNSQDAQLAAFTAITGSNGIATVGLDAGQAIKQFQVRASAPNASALTFDVTVSTDPIGTIVVEMRYTGAEPLNDYRAYLFQQECNTMDPFNLPTALQAAAPVQVLSDRPFFPNVQAGSGYSVVVVASVGGEILATGCTDQQIVTAGQVTTTIVNLGDLPIIFDGVYDLDNVFDMTGALPPSVATILQLLDEMTDDHDPLNQDPNDNEYGDDPAAFILDFVYRQFCKWECTSGDWDSCVFGNHPDGHPYGDLMLLYTENFQTWSGAQPIGWGLCGGLEIAHDWAEPNLQSWIESNVPDIVLNLAQMAGDLSRAFTQMHITSVLTISDVAVGGPEGAFTHELKTMITEIHDWNGTPHTYIVDLAMAGLTTISYSGSTIAVDDKLQIPAHTFELDFGKLLQYVYLNGILPLLGYTDTADMFQDLVNCLSLGEWLRDHDGIDDWVIDETDYEGWCNLGLQAAGDYIDDSMAGWINATTEITLQGECEAGSINANRVALTLVNGVWQGTIVEGNFNANFTGTFTGTRR